MKTLAEKYITVMPGDCIGVLATLPDNSFDSCVTDPPYHLTSIVKRFGGHNAAPAQFGKDGAYARASAGFMGKQWDGGDIAQSVELWTQVYRVLKPGAHLLAFGGTRTYHRMACAIEDAGFEIRDCIQWLYGSGFPKSHSVSVAIDKSSGIGPRGKAFNMKGDGGREEELAANGREFLPPYEPHTDSARQWQGWGTALKPACEPIVLARKPLSEKTVAANVLKWGTGAINVDGCRVAIDPNVDDMLRTVERGKRESETWETGSGFKNEKNHLTGVPANGRWPANVIHDGSDEVVGAFPETATGFRPNQSTAEGRDGIVFGAGLHQQGVKPYDDQGSAARFFYTAKADGDDRLGSKHPTIKPLDLMQYLVRLITPKGGTCLDPFAGTGTTGEAAFREGMHALLIERETEYLADIKRRIALCNSGPDERARGAMKEKLKGKPRDDGPLFSEWDAMWSKPFDKPEYIKGNGSL